MTSDVESATKARIRRLSLKTSGLTTTSDAHWLSTVEARKLEHDRSKPPSQKKEGQPALTILHPRASKSPVIRSIPETILRTSMFFRDYSSLDGFWKLWDPCANLFGVDNTGLLLTNSI